MYGRKTYEAPTIIRGRWEDRSDQIINQTGAEVLSRSRVYTTGPLQIGGYLLLGESADVDPRTTDGAREIQQVGRIPDLRANKSLHTAFM